MPMYRYSATDSSGDMVTGKIKANSEAEVAAHLAKKLLLPISIEETTEKNEFSFKKLAKLNISIKKGISIEELIVFTRNMATMLAAGVPILRSLRQLSLNVKSVSFQNVLLTIEDEIRSGKSLTKSLEGFPDYFPPIYISIVEIGESTGNLDGVFSKLSELLEIENTNAKRLSSALRYPKIVISVMLIAMLVINVLVVPAFKKLFSSFKTELPIPTKILMATSDFIMNYWFVIVAIIVVSIFIFARLKKIYAFRYFLDRFKLKVPVIGELIKKIILTRFIWSLSLMIKSGIPLIDCLELSSSAVANIFLQKKLLKVKTGVETAKTFSQAIKEVSLFDPIVMQIIYIGDESGMLDEVLAKAAKEMDEQNDYMLKKLSDLIEPFVLLLLGVMVATLALAVFLPLWDMAGAAMKK